MRGRLLRVSWQDQSDKIQSITVQWEPIPTGDAAGEVAHSTTIEELCIHIYKQRKKINLALRAQAHIGRLSASRKKAVECAFPVRPDT